jgi:hypothetical protein
MTFQKGDKVVVTIYGEENEWPVGTELFIEERCDGEHEGSYFAYPIDSTDTDHDFFHKNDTYLIHGSSMELAEAQP